MVTMDSASTGLNRTTRITFHQACADMFWVFVF
jgi:hypothetical protein